MSDVGVNKWRSLWNEGHSIQPWFTSNEQDPESARAERVSQFFNLVVNPALGGDNPDVEEPPLHVLVTIDVWNEIIGEGSINEWLVPATNEVQVNTGLLGNIDNVFFWTDAFTDDKAKDSDGDILSNAFVFLSSVEKKLVDNLVAEAAPSIADLLPTNVEGFTGEAPAEPSVDAAASVEVSIVFGDKKETKDHRQSLKAMFDRMHFSEMTNTGIKKTKAVKVASKSVYAQFKSKNLADYEGLAAALNAVMEEGSVKFVVKQGETKVSLPVTVTRVNASCDIETEYGTENLMPSIYGEIEATLSE